jgi:ParB family chromosome partitioning protein
MVSRLFDAVQNVPVDRINVVNGRSRGQSKFKQIVANIARLGLKKPIAVALRNGRDGTDPHYDLICGQGRLEAYKARGERLVPAIVYDAAGDDLLLMSLIENLARRRYRTIDLAREIKAMKERGDELADIARKTDLDVSYVRGILRLVNGGEARLLQAVDSGQIPMSVAVVIASADDQAIQKALTDAYENKTLRGKALLRAKRLVDGRHRPGRGRGKNRGGRGGGPPGDGAGKGVNGGDLSYAKLMRVYEAETARQGELVRKAKLCENRLVFIVSALKCLFQDRELVSLLRETSLDTMPRPLAELVEGRGRI